MSKSKTFSVAGWSTLNGKVKTRIANGSPEARTKVLERGGHKAVQLFKMPRALVSESAHAWAEAHADFPKDAVKKSEVKSMAAKPKAKKAAAKKAATPKAKATPKKAAAPKKAPAAAPAPAAEAAPDSSEKSEEDPGVLPTLTNDSVLKDYLAVFRMTSNPMRRAKLEAAYQGRKTEFEGDEAALNTIETAYKFLRKFLYLPS
jgi:hypothetical protein